MLLKMSMTTLQSCMSCKGSSSSWQTPAELRINPAGVKKTEITHFIQEAGAAPRQLTWSTMVKHSQHSQTFTVHRPHTETAS
jgi:hypothetical protein